MKYYYEIVSGGEITDCQVNEDASQEDIEAAIRELTKEIHPDQSDIPNASELMADLNTIKEVLRTQRGTYNATPSHEEFVNENPDAGLSADWSTLIPELSNDADPEANSDEEPGTTETSNNATTSNSQDTTASHNQANRSSSSTTGDDTSTSDSGSRSGSSGSRFDDSATHDPDPGNRGAMHDSGPETNGSRAEDDINNRFDNPSNYQGGYPPDWDARRKAVYKRDDYTCQNCGVKSGPHAGDGGVSLHAHHVVGLGKGGTNAISNLITLCKPCHFKGAHGERASSQAASNSTTKSSTSSGTADSGGTLSEEEAQKAREDERFIGGLIQFVVATPLYMFAAAWFLDLPTNELWAWGLAMTAIISLLAGIYILIYVGICTAYTTRTVWYHGIWYLLMLGFNQNWQSSVVMAGVAAILGLPLVVAGLIKYFDN